MINHKHHPDWLQQENARRTDLGIPLFGVMPSRAVAAEPISEDQLQVMLDELDHLSTAAPSTLGDQLADAIRQNRARERALRDQFAGLTAGIANDNLVDTATAEALAEIDRALEGLAETERQSSKPIEAPAEHARPVRKNPQKRPRRSYTRSRKNVAIIAGYARDARQLRPGPSVETQTPHHPIPTPQHTLPTSPTPSLRPENTDSRKAPAWRYTTEIEQGTCYIRTVSATDRSGLSFTLNVGGRVLKAANENPTRFKTYIHNRIEKALKASPLGFRDFMFELECTNDGRVHLHGAIDAGESEKPLVEASLARAGGSWHHTRHKDRQAHAAVMFCPDGWARYCGKARAHTRRVMRIKSTLSVTRGCRARGQTLWEKSRRLVSKAPSYRADQ